MAKGPFDNNSFYSTTELIELGQKDLFPIKTMATLNRLINKKRIRVTNVGTGKRKVYRIRGEWINNFLKEVKV